MAHYFLADLHTAHFYRVQILYYYYLIFRVEWLGDYIVMIQQWE